jgi:aspartyl-tRNA(Asn)/glutamyl-tRNA(Gln) amidotransferase subunit A
MFRISVMGPLTRTVRDAALFLDTVTGHHPSDPDSLPAPGLSYLDCLSRVPSGLKIAYSPDLGYANVEKDVAERVAEAVEAFEELGHSVELISDRFPNVTKGWSKLMNLDTYALVRKTLEKNRDDMGRSFAASIDQAKSITVHELIEAQELRADLNKTLWDLFDKYDLLVTPTMPTEAFGAKGPPPSEINGQPINIIDAVAFTFPFNFSGHPAASVRAGFSNNGLPVGLQIVGPRQREDLVLQASLAFEQVRPWNDNWPEQVG